MWLLVLQNRKDMFLQRTFRSISTHIVRTRNYGKNIQTTIMITNTIYY